MLRAQIHAKIYRSISCTSCPHTDSLAPTLTACPKLGFSPRAFRLCGGQPLGWSFPRLPLREFVIPSVARDRGSIHRRRASLAHAPDSHSLSGSYRQTPARLLRLLRPAAARYGVKPHPRHGRRKTTGDSAVTGARTVAWLIHRGDRPATALEVPGFRLFHLSQHGPFVVRAQYMPLSTGRLWLGKNVLARGVSGP